MSRVSLNKRIAALLEAAEHIDPFAARVHRMPPALRMRYENWRRECDRIHADAEREGGPGAAYERMLDGTLNLPDPPRAVADALGFNGAPVLANDLSDAELADIYAEMIGD